MTRPANNRSKRENEIDTTRCVANNSRENSSGSVVTCRCANYYQTSLAERGKNHYQQLSRKWFQSVEHDETWMKEATLTASLAHAGSIINNLQVRRVKSRWGKRYFNTYYRCSVVVHGVNCIKSASWIRVGGKLVGCEMNFLLFQPDFYYWRCSEAQSYQYCELRVAVPYRRVPDTNIIINICYIHWRRLHQGCRFRPWIVSSSSI